MRIILGKAPDAKQSMEDPGALITVDSAQFSIPYRQAAVTPEAAFIYAEMKRTVHRF